MEELREKLYKAIDKYGISDERTIAISEELNKFIFTSQKQYCY
ncbi:aspartyl-phosphate phosphatase Spo0E family protein [Clostridioides difficile]